MSRQRRPLPPEDSKPESPAADADRPRGPGRSDVGADGSGVASGLANALQNTVGWKRITGEGLSESEKEARRATDTRDALQQLSIRQIKAAVKAAGGGTRSDRTIRRWKQNGRIPDSQVAELVRRRASIAELGGVKAAAQMLGRSPSAIYAWQAGRTHDLSKDAGKKLHRHEVLTAVRRHTQPAAVTKAGQPGGAKAGLLGGAKPMLRITGRIGFVGNGTKYPPRERTMDLSLAQWPERDVEELMVAINDREWVTVQQIIERVATEGWATGGGGYDRQYDDQNGFRIESLDDAYFYLGK